MVEPALAAAFSSSVNRETYSTPLLNSQSVMAFDCANGGFNEEGIASVPGKRPELGRCQVGSCSLYG